MLKRIIVVLALLLFGTLTAYASVPDTTYLNNYTGNGSSTVYSFTWRLIDSSQMFVQLNGVTQSTSSYTVFTNTSGIGGTVTFNSAPANGAVILIERQSDLLQLDVLQNNGALPPAVLEAMIDKLTIIAQQLENQITNSGTLPLNPAKGTLLVGTGTGWSQLAPPITNGWVLEGNSAASLGLDYVAQTGGGGGGTTGTVNNGAANQLASYLANGTAVSGINNLIASQMLPLTAAQLYLGNASNIVTPTTVTGDFSLSSAGLATLASVGSAGTTAFPSAVTVDAKGRVTSITGGRFISGLQSITASADISAAHGLGVTPIHLWVVLVNQTTDRGYSPGDQLVMYPAPGMGGTTNGFSMLADGTNVHMYTNNAPVSVATKGGGNYAAITAADWKAELVAEP